MKFKGLEEVENIEITNQEATQIEISLLKPNPYQPRLKDKDIETLAESIKTYGQLQPIVVNQDNVIVGGHRRYYAHIHLKKEFIKCTKIHTNRNELYTLAVIENEERESLTDLERGLSYKLALDDGLYNSNNDLATALNKSPSHVTKMLNLLKLPEEIQKDIRVHKRSYSVETLNCLMKIEDETLLKDTYYKYITGAINRKDVQEIAKNQKVKVESAIVKVSRNKLKVEYDLKGLDKEKQGELEEEIQSILDRFLLSKNPSSIAAVANLVVVSGLLKFIM